MTRVEIDLNVRVRGNATLVGLEDADGPLWVGQDVTVYERESGVEGPGKVLELRANGLAILSVEWGMIS